MRARAFKVAIPVLVGVALVTLSACNFLPYIPPPTPTTTTTTVPHVGTMFDEQFNGASLDTTKWTAMNRPGDASNAEIGCYKPSNVTQSAGSLVIRTAADTSCSGFNYTSGMIQTKSFAFTYGTVEFRAKFAGGAGPWPAVWMLGANCQVSNVTSANNTPPCNWPQPGSDEIDIAEIVAGNKGNVNEFVFMGNGTGGCSTTTTDTSLNWHTYQLIWAPGHLTWKIDGATTCTETAHVPSTPMFLIINTAVGGAGGGAVNPSTLPQFSNIDYLTVNA
jgi:beta-glucanase (GH16 family)